ncbi:hypothetical protein Tsubulata_006602 [Turnera subulata]|uniref:Uncharacterized protein n=1 Tax=Turnera subulata TaxID=218843 RepID=A0A9Q0FDD7_9ROSI|nr:hypothetical protein Tsubulata_006602 [Turnera subulata]
MAAEEEDKEPVTAAAAELEEEEVEAEEEQKRRKDNSISDSLLAASYLGLSFSLFLALLPRNSSSLIPNLRARISDLSLRLRQAEEQLRQMKSRRKEDSKANARVVEIFATHRNAWQAEERRLLQQIDAAGEEAAALRAKLREVEKEREECRDRIHDLEMAIAGAGPGGCCGNREAYGGEEDGEEVEEEEEEEEVEEENSSAPAAADNLFYAPHSHSQYPHHSFLDSSASKFWNQRPSSLWQRIAKNHFITFFVSQMSWFEIVTVKGSDVRYLLLQDVQYESLESLYPMKHFVARRESPWKVDGESIGVPAKLKVLEDELLNLEKVGNGDVSKVPSLMRKQAKRYHTLMGKIDDLCRRMQTSDPGELATVSPEFRTQRQTEFLLEAFRLQQRASETGQKLMALQTEIVKSYHGDELGCQTKLSMRRSMESIRNNLREIQRNLEIWLARIIGDLEGILARDGASQAREYYLSRYPFVQ